MLSRSEYRHALFAARARAMNRRPFEVATPPRARRGRPTLIILAILGIEAGVIGGAVGLLDGPAKARATADDAATPLEGDRIVECLVLNERMLNHRSGVGLLHEVEIWIHVRAKHQGWVSRELTQFQNQIRSELTALWRAAELRDVNDPALQRLTLRVQALLEARFGADPANGEPVVLEAFIVTGPAFRVDG